MQKQILAAFSILFSSTWILAAKPAQAEPLVGLTTTNTIISFDSETPQTIDRTLTVTGLQAGENLVGIDFRPANGGFYALGSSSRLYSIDLDSGAATAVGATPFTTALAGTNFGVDFNPVADALRVVSDTGQNLRVNPETGALTAADTALEYIAGDPNEAGTPGAVAAAYTNNFTGASTTTLLVLDSTTDTIALQGGEAGTPSPNGGVLTTLGSAGVDTTADAGFEISSLSGVPYLAMTRAGESSSELYSISFGTAFPVVRLGAIGSDTVLRDLAAPILENTVPTLAIVSPTRASSRTRRNRVTFSGTADDNVYVESVQYRYRVRGERFTQFAPATGTNNWSFVVPSSRQGATTVEIKAIDVFGNESEVTTYRVVRQR